MLWPVWSARAEARLHGRILGSIRWIAENYSLVTRRSPITRRGGRWPPGSASCRRIANSKGW